MRVRITGIDSSGTSYTNLELEVSRVVYGRTQDPDPTLEDTILELYPVGKGEPALFYIVQVKIFSVLTAEPRCTNCMQVKVDSVCECDHVEVSAESAAAEVDDGRCACGITWRFAEEKESGMCAACVSKEIPF
ncbi:hypothetical protein LCGC14_1041200 [marine sediment metagenome]|uniref:Uncharacterized protein n=1 Tax=marine sediment metagenome TaxID=412755 RepID=A0A0F9NDD6_9ZZZZ